MRKRKSKTSSKQNGLVKTLCKIKNIKDGTKIKIKCGKQNKEYTFVFVNV